VTALIEFDQLGDLKGGAISLYQYKGGKLEYVETMGGSAMDLAKSEVKDAVAAVKEAGKAVPVRRAKPGSKWARMPPRRARKSMPPRMPLRRVPMRSRRG
jgi:hypothetical protein